MIGVATGFVAVKPGRSTKYLVTNRHVVRGRHNETDHVLHSGGAIPDQLEILHNSASGLGSWELRTETLYTAKGSPRWREHHTQGGAIDVVTLPLRNFDDGVVLYPFDPWNPGESISALVTSPLYVIGFPFGETGGGGLGIWVRGSIATEPAVDYGDLPRFLIDSRTRPGQSGSPVIAYNTGGAVAMDDGSTAMFSSPVQRFVGVYSGRINEQSDLGFVWRASVVADLIDQGVTGSA